MQSVPTVHPTLTNLVKLDDFRPPADSPIRVDMLSEMFLALTGEFTQIAAATADRETVSTARVVEAAQALSIMLAACDVAIKSGGFTGRRDELRHIAAAGDGILRLQVLSLLVRLELIARAAGDIERSNALTREIAILVDPVTTKPVEFEIVVTE